MIRLSHANPGRLRQLEEWRNFSSLNAIAQKPAHMAMAIPTQWEEASGTGLMEQSGQTPPPMTGSETADLAT